MAEDDTSTMNLDLNLGPVDNSSVRNDIPEDAINLEEWLHNPARRTREIVRHRQRWRSLWRQLPIPPETRNLALEFIGSAPHSGEASVPSDGTPADEAPKISENRMGCVEDDTQGGKKKDVKSNADEGSFFDCNICLDLAREPVVTCCGHLFCWPCIYSWLHHHSDAQECPVCKGEVGIRNVTPIYGCGNTTLERDTDSSLNIPQRPQGHRVESWRQTIQMAAFTIPMEEIIRRLRGTFDLSWELAQTQAQSSDNPPGELLERSGALVGRLLTNRGLRRERGDVVPALSVGDSTGRVSQVHDMGDGRWLSSVLLRRSGSHRVGTLSNLTSVMGDTEIETPDGGLTLADAYYDSNSRRGLDRELVPPVDDRDDSLSSIAAMIHSGSQMVDNAVETESMVSLSTSSSRRRYDAVRISSDVDGGDLRLRPPRRRRLN